MSAPPRGRRRPALRHWALVGLVVVLVLSAVVVALDDGVVHRHKKVSQLTIVALGDSVASGTHCGCVAFPQLVGERLENANRMVSVYNVAGDGYTVDTVNQQLDNMSSLGTWVSQASIVTLTVGANALAPLEEKGPSCAESCYRPAVDAVAVRLGALVKRLHDAERAKGARLLWTNYWNVFQDGQQGIAAQGKDFVAWSNAVTVYANTAYAQQVVANGGEVVDLYTAFKGRQGTQDPTGLLASDGDHPDAAGHELIATTIEKVLNIT